MSEPIANVDMANAWDGEEGDQWTQFADEFDTNFRSIWARFLETDPIAPADRVLDIGCGSGQSTRDAARLARDGSALGVDLSGPMRKYTPSTPRPSTSRSAVLDRCSSVICRPLLPTSPRRCARKVAWPCW